MEAIKKNHPTDVRFKLSTVNQPVIASASTPTSSLFLAVTYIAHSLNVNVNKHEKYSNNNTLI